MFVAMNRFRIALGRENDFEDVWRNRETHLDGVPGFQQFNLLKGPVKDEFALYASHSIWDSQDAFVAWTKSEAFKLAHRNVGDNRDLYLGPPEFEGFEPVL